MIHQRHFILVKFLLVLAALGMIGWLYRNLQTRESSLHNDARMQQVFSQERRTLVSQVLNARLQDEPILRYKRLSRVLPDDSIQGLPNFVDEETFASWIRWQPEAPRQVPDRLLWLLDQNDRFFSGIPKRYAALVEIWRNGAAGVPAAYFPRLYEVAADFWQGTQIDNHHYRFLLERLPEPMSDTFCDQLLLLGSYPPYSSGNWLYFETEDQAFLLDLPSRELDRLNADIASLRIGISLKRSETWQSWGAVRANLVPYYTPLTDQIREVRLIHISIGLLIGLTLFALYMVINRYERVYRLQKQLLAATSHELRTPVSVLRQFAEMLQDRQDQFTPKIQKYHNFIHRESMRMQFLVENLLSTAKFENLKLALNPTAIDLKTWLEEWTEAANLLDDKSEITCRFPKDVTVYWDATLMSQVVTNLIDNAQKHAGTDIDIHAETQGDWVILTFRDYGNHIQWQRLKHIRAFKGISKPDKGLGLGLYLIQQIIHRHKGTLTFTDAQPGLRVTLKIPIKPITLSHKGS